MSSVNKHPHFVLGIGALLLCSFIWGTAFVAQSLGGKTADPFTLNSARNAIATLFLFALCPLLDKLRGIKYSLWGTDNPDLKRRLWKGGFISGVCLTFAVFMQQWGIMYTTAGKSGFITALYIVLVPIMGLFIFRNTVTLNNWLGVLIATIGMYFICITESFSITKGDFITLACPFLFAMQILVVDRFIPELDGVRFSMVQFGVSSLLSTICMFIFENPSFDQITGSIGPLLYLGLLSSGIAYTLQIIGQKYVASVLASIIMSLESVFALLSGWLYLNQTLSARELIGCVLMFLAISVAQLPSRHRV